MSHSTTKILIANNSLAAIKFIISLSSRDITFLGMVTSHDLRSNQLYVNYLNRYLIVENYGVDEILRAATYFEPDLVWPGWGHSSENYLLPKALKESGYRFMGPNENAMRMLGDKIMSNRFAEKNGIPCIPYTTDIGAFMAFFQSYGTAMIKSSDSGGGKGIEIVETQKQLSHFLEQYAKRVGTSQQSEMVVSNDTECEHNQELNGISPEQLCIADGDELAYSLATAPLGISSETTGQKSAGQEEQSVFMTKIIKNARHVELQVVRDNFGNAVLLGTRDCTIQRRHQKIIEEGPAILTDQFYEHMKRCAKTLLIASNYVGVATVEFLVTEQHFYFLEVNTRIQVEHPVTELNAQVNIPELQLDVAMNRNLCLMEDKQSMNHVVAARITAEDNNFNPQTGHISVSFLPSKNTLLYFSVLNGQITEQNDSQFGHVFAYGRNRREATTNLITALMNVKITGIDSPIPRVLGILTSRFFAENDIYTDTLEKFRFVKMSEEDIAFFSAAYFLMSSNPHVSFAYNDDCFFTRCHVVSSHEMLVELNGTFYKIRSVENCTSHVNNKQPREQKTFFSTFTFNDSLVTFSTVSQNTYRMLNQGSNTFTLLTQNITAPFNGRIVEINDGYVERDGVLFVIEAMKTRTHIRSKDNLLYTKLKTEGSIVSVGDNILKIESNKITCNTAARFTRNYDENDLMRWTRHLHALPSLLYTFPADERIFDLIRVHCIHAMGVIEHLEIDEEQCVRIRNELESVLVKSAVDKDVLRFYYRIVRMCTAMGMHRSASGTLGAEQRADTDTEQQLMGVDGHVSHTKSAPLDDAKYAQSEKSAISQKNERKPCLMKLSAFQSVDDPVVERFTAHSFTHEQFNSKFCACPRIECRCTGQHGKSIIIRARDVTNELIVFVRVFTGWSYALYTENNTNVEKIRHMFTKIVCNGTVYLNTRGYAEIFVYEKKRVREYYLDGLKVNIPDGIDLKARYEGFLYLMYIYLCTINVPMCYKELFLTDFDDCSETVPRRVNEPVNSCQTSNSDVKRGNDLAGQSHCTTSTNTKYSMHDNQAFPSEADLNRCNDRKYALSYDRKIKIGVLAYVFYINGEDIVFVINDWKFKCGSFSYKELIFFHFVNLLCTTREMARIHFSNNSGARIGIDEEVMSKLIVKEQRGGLELYMREEDRDGLSGSCTGGRRSGANTERMEHVHMSISNETTEKNRSNGVENGARGLKHLKYITTNDDSGPENLSYSSQSSISTIEAYNRTFTLSFVTNHSVGIGAYLAVLGKRVIMKRSSVMLLTGYKALNKLNQTEIYSSNEQLGGVDIMCGNNVCQRDVLNEYEGLCEIFRWLMFWIEGKKFRARSSQARAGTNTSVNSGACPTTRGQSDRGHSSKAIDGHSTGTKDVSKREDSKYDDECAAPALSLNCREVIEVIAHSITEYSSAFSSNIKTVRCFIKDMPVGVIYAYENGTCVLDAPSSEKFSTFIDQINRENLNLVIMANFKGFSGGDTDMKQGILKQGSKIIENLKIFRNKIFVYIGCGWQVRGGTFVILDKFINERIRVFVSRDSRIGIMQPSGLSEVKFKKKERIRILEKNGLVVDERNINELAIKFCELHDHPERMVCKGRVDGMLEIGELESKIYEYFNG